MSEDLKNIFSEGREISIGDHKIVIKQIALGDIPTILDIVSKVFEVMPKNKQKVGDIKKEILAAVSKDFDSILKVLSVTTDLSSENISRLNLGATAKIVEAVIKDNVDFFQSHVVPALQELAQNLAGMGKSKS